MKFRNLFAPEGLRLNNEDAGRKFINSIVFCKMNPGNGGVVPKVDGEPVKIEAMEYPNILLRLEAVADWWHYKNILETRLFPPFGIVNYQTDGHNVVLRGWRTGDRQWNLGLNNQGFTSALERESGSQDLGHNVTWRMAKAFFTPTYFPFKEAWAMMQREPHESIAITPMYWIRRMPNKSVGKFTLYRKQIPVGMWMNKNEDSFYLNSPCSIFEEDINNLLERH